MAMGGRTDFRLVKSSLPSPDTDIQAQFDAHKCKLVDSSQNALRIVRESAENK
jgi:hypothetical protein